MDLTSKATDTRGSTATSSITVTAATNGRYIKLTPTMASGTSPLEVLLKIDGSFTITNSDLSSSGPGPVEYLPGTAVDEYTVRMTAEGTYTFTAEVMDDQNAMYTDAVTVVVVNKTSLDAMLKAKWEGMKAAFGNRNIEGSAAYFAEGVRDTYREHFTRLSQYLPQMAADMGEVRLIKILSWLAEYDLRTIRNGATYSFQVLFMKDRDGIWRLRSF